MRKVVWADMGLILYIGAAMLVAVFNQWFEIYQNKTPRKSWF